MKVRLPHPHTLLRRVISAVAGLIASEHSTNRDETVGARNEMVLALNDLEDRIIAREHRIMAEISRLEDGRRDVYMLTIYARSEEAAIKRLFSLARHVDRIDRIERETPP